MLSYKCSGNNTRTMLELLSLELKQVCGFPKIRGTLVGVYWGPHFGKPPFDVLAKDA